MSFPLGQDATGFLIYAPDGRMAVQLVAGARPALATADALLGGDEKQRAAAYSTCLAYFGRYTIKDHSVVHDIEASLFPNWSGQQQVRPFTLDGDSLTLHTPPVHLPSGDVTNALTWVRENDRQSS